MTYPRRFLSYRWFKPLLVGLVFFGFYMVFANVVTILAVILTGNREAAKQLFESLARGYDGFDVYSAPGALATAGSVAVMMPALFLAAKIIRDRPISSYSSSMGGFRMGVFLKSLLISLPAVIPMVITLIIDGRTGANRFTAAGFIIITLLGPFQCIAEEYIFRGFLMQTFGGWFKIWPLAVVLQVAVFAALHPYNLAGIVAVAALGLAFGFLTQYTRGIEASSALHIVNNMLAFYASGLGFGLIQSESTWRDTIMSCAAIVIYVALVVLLNRKFHWFDKVKKDDVTPFNARVAARLEARKKG